MQMAVAYKLPSDGSPPDSLSNGTELKFDEPAYALQAGQEGDWESEVLRVVYSSLTTPNTVIDQSLATGNRLDFLYLFFPLVFLILVIFMVHQNLLLRELRLLGFASSKFYGRIWGLLLQHCIFASCPFSGFVIVARNDSAHFKPC